MKNANKTIKIPTRTPKECPHLYEVEDMLAFCKSYRQLYIYGCAANQQYLLKFFDICEVDIAGFVVTNPCDEPCWVYRKLPIRLIDDVAKESETGVVIGLSDKYFNFVIPRLRQLKFTDYFLMSEYNKQTIASKLRPTYSPQDMVVTIHLTDHCNLNCRMCVAFSPLAKPAFHDIEVFKRDMERLAELSDNGINFFVLEGGEPLLHRDINQFIEITRRLFPNCSIIITTNGLLLLDAEKAPGGNFWKCCAENAAKVFMTSYPIEVDVQAIEDKAREYGVRLRMFGNIAWKLKIEKVFEKHPLDLTGTREKHQFISCFQFNECVYLRNGRLHPCLIAPSVRHFNEAFGKNLAMSEADSIDIYKAESYEELAEFVATRIPFCRYCDVKNRRAKYEWARSEKAIDEYVD